MVGRLPLEQLIGVRIPVPEQTILVKAVGYAPLDQIEFYTGITSPKVIFRLVFLYFLLKNSKIK